MNAERTDDEERETSVLKILLLATPPDHKTKAKSKASPEKTESDWLQGIRRLADEAATGCGPFVNSTPAFSSAARMGVDSPFL